MSIFSCMEKGVSKREICSDHKNEQQSEQQQRLHDYV